MFEAVGRRVAWIRQPQTVAGTVHVASAHAMLIDEGEFRASASDASSGLRADEDEVDNLHRTGPACAGRCELRPVTNR